MIVSHNTIKTLLGFSSKLWFISLVFAQVIFVTYLILGYGTSFFANDLSAWNQFNNTAYREGDLLGNSFYGMHVLLAIVMIIGGSFQLLPQIRKRFIRLHKYNGRIYITLACIISFAGMYLIIVRGTVGDAFLHSMTFFSGIVIFISSYFALRNVRAGNLLQHQDWAIRLYLAANGVLFFRLLIFAWFLLFGTLGVDTDNFTGPTVYAISISAYILPLLLFECFRFAKKTNQKSVTLIMTFGLIVIALIFMIGLFGISMGNWFPSIFAQN